ncbi:MAG: hypothetical protein ABSE46_11095 [Terracidiphilus sp.]|jgi:hypothetical protein
MTARRNNWIDVDMGGLRKLLARRGKEFAIYELVQNAWDEPNVTQVEVTLSRPLQGQSVLTVMDDAPEGFRDLSHAHTMYAESYKKSNPEQRGFLNLGEKLVLALCDSASIESTTGTVAFSSGGRTRSSKRRAAGTQFTGVMRLTLAEYDQMLVKSRYLIPDTPTTINGESLPTRRLLARFETILPTVIADEEGSMHPTKRMTTVRVYEPLPGETPMLYEMGIPVVETSDTWHIDIRQKVPLDMERSNVTPSFLAAVRVAVLNTMRSDLDAELASLPWVRAAASDSKCENDTITSILDLRFGADRVSFDLSDIGSNREAASKNFTVVTGGSLTKGEWDNARRAKAITPAGQRFPTDPSGSKVPDKVYTRDEWTPAMEAYGEFVERVSPALVGSVVTLEYIEDPKMVHGEFHDTYFVVNLAHHDVRDWQSNIELMLHELAHTVVKSNDHLSHRFYETVGTLGAKLAILVAEDERLASSLE